MANDDILARLRAVDFFEAWPADAVARAEAFVRREGREPAPGEDEHEGLALMSLWFDFETFDGPSRYVELMKEFAAASFGVFNPTKISARRRGDHVVLRYEHLGQKHECEIPFEEDSDWVEDEFLDALREGCHDLPGPLVFHKIDDGQAAGFVLATTEAYDRAVAAGLVPARNESRVALSADAGATPAAKKALAQLDESGYFAPFPPALASRLRRRVIDAVGRGETAGAGLVVAEIHDADLKTAEGARKLLDQIREHAPEALAEGTTIDVRAEGDGLAWTLSAGDLRRSEAKPHVPASRDYVIDYLIGDLNALREDATGTPPTFVLAHYWRFKAKGKPWRVWLRPTSEFNDWVAADYPARTKAGEN
jgi:hypothetical protein